MIKIIKSPLAEDDLLDIWQYSYDKWGVDKAAEYLMQLNTGMQGLTSNPMLGKSRDVVRRGYRSIQINRHVIYFRRQGNTIDIVRVLHERMMPAKHL